MQSSWQSICEDKGWRKCDSPNICQFVVDKTDNMEYVRSDEGEETIVMKYDSFEIAAEGQVTGPVSLHAYLLDSISVAPEKKRPAVIVCEGGGYAFRSDREGEPVVMQFLAMGYHGFLLDYSVAPNRFPTALQELASAVALVRDHAEEWNVDPNKILVCGFSAAGHLCCSLGVYWNQEFVYGPIGRTKEEIRPDGMILCYPVITSGIFAHEGSFKCLLGDDALLGDRGENRPEREKQVSLDLQVTDQTVKTFVWHTYEDQSVPLENSLLLVNALRKHNIQFEYHVFPKGPHGSSLANEETSGVRTEMVIPSAQPWIKLAGTWIEGL